MRLRLFFVAIMTVSLAFGSLFVVMGCGDDDDDDSGDDTSDFDDDTSYASDDDTADPSQGGESCGCSGCEGCAATYSAVAIARLTEDFEALNPEYGADELGYYLDGARLTECEGACFGDMLSETVSCVDDALNCSFACDDAGCVRACSGKLNSCLKEKQAAFTSCLSPCDSPCAHYVNCAMGCEADASTPDQAASCLTGCMDRFESCSPLFAKTEQVRCFTGLAADFSEITSLDDAMSLYQDYAACVK